MIDLAICISTRNRKDAFLRAMEHWREYFPHNSTMIVVDDASDDIYAPYCYRFKERAGIPAVKNKCLSLAMATGARWIVLADDDVYPVSANWHLPYINSGLHHLCFSFSNQYQNMTAKKRWEQDGFMRYTLGNGCCMFFTRECIERVGGFRTEYGYGCYEHVDLSNRIHRAGLIPHPFIDVIGSDKLLHSMDANNEVQRSFTDLERARLIQKNYPIFAQKRLDTNFVPYDT